MRIAFKKLNFPAGLNLDLLKRVLSEEKLRTLIALSAKKNRVERRIVLPSDRCLRKAIAYYAWTEILAGKITWSRLKRELRETGSLRSLKLTKTEMHRLWKQREKEIKKEQQ
jgi:hypothetical protein